MLLNVAVVVVVVCVVVLYCGDSGLCCGDGGSEALLVQ